MAPKRSASTTPTPPLRRSKRIAQPIVEQPVEILVKEDADQPIGCTESQKEDGDYKEVGVIEKLGEDEEVDGDSRQAVLERRQTILQQMNLPSDLFDQPDVNWLEILLEASEASADMKVAI